MDTKMANEIPTGVLSGCMTTTHIVVPDFLYNYGIEYFESLNRPQTDIGSYLGPTLEAYLTGLGFCNSKVYRATLKP